MAASFLAAILAGTWPPKTVNAVLIRIKITPCMRLRAATPLKPVIFSKIIFAGKVNNHAIKTPKIPEPKPSIVVSASNTRVISLFLAPKAFLKHRSL